jgi:membrane protein YqaA with SNARE-associated domain
MNIQITEVLRCVAALVVGGLIGYAFGTIQQIALRRNEKRQQSGQLNNGWAVMPGSGRRVAYLLVALVLVQIICPLFFVNGSQWWVSGGVVLGYGGILLRQLRQRQGSLKR